MALSNSVDQRRANARGDVVGRDKVEHHHHYPASPGVIDQLVIKLHSEMKSNAQIRHTVESLQFFHQRKSADGIVGLQAKLEAAQRNDELLFAFEKKELFVKLLDRWSMYASAQEIFAYLLAKIEHEFAMHLRPKLNLLTEEEINELMNSKMILPTILECGSGVFTLNHTLVMGMIYWLAEQCFVRWHP